MTSKQLNMQFEGENPLASLMREGQFLMLIEVNSPADDQPFASAIAAPVALAKRIGKTPEIAGLAVTDRLNREECHDPVEMASAMANESSKMPLLHISGKGSDPERIRDILARAASSGIKSVLAVTGDRSDRHPEPTAPGKIPEYAGGYLDSLDILARAKSGGNDFFAGAGINPFKYTPADQYLQYYKMLRKLATGADFLVTHSGWDMKKLQELQWYLQMRDIGHPVIARLTLLSVEDIENIHEGIFPGVQVAKTYAAMLQRESNINATQSLSAQLQRMALQVAGCKLLGYNGVQIAGIRNPQALDMVISKTREALGTYTSYPEWIEAWNEFHHGISFDPTHDAYYVFSGLLNPEQQMFSQSECPLTDRELPASSLQDRIFSAAAEILTGDKMPAGLADAFAGMLFRGFNGSREKLSHCFHLNPAACPKGLVYGACGGSGPEGVCEFGHATCFFHRVLALAAQRHLLDRLETPVCGR